MVALAMLLAALPVMPSQAQALRVGRAPSAPPGPPAPVLTLDRTNQRDWTVHAQVRVFPAQYTALNPRDILPSPRFMLDRVDVLYPLLERSAWSVGRPERLKGELRQDTVPADTLPEVQGGFQGLSSVASWTCAPVNASNLWLLVDVSSTCYQTRIDERRARERAWPAAPWGPELALCLEDQAYIDPADPAIAALVRTWLGNGPRNRGPYDTAKYLAGKVVEHYRVTLPGVDRGRRTPFSGLVGSRFTSSLLVAGSDIAARAGEGPPHDMANLLVAVWRAAGIPARLVIGLDVRESQQTESGVAIRAWGEFFLAHPIEGVNDDGTPRRIGPLDGEWIPFDVVRQRAFSSRAPRLEYRWQFFGHHEESDFVVPLAFHWFPPADATNAGGPALWGWRPRPGNPVADQSISFRAFETPRRGDDPPRRE